MSKKPRPNLFVIGAMKSGTTYLHALLAEHPCIFMCTPKEPCYFVKPDELKMVWPELWRKGIWKNEGNYLTLFEKAGDAKVIGESSAEYTKAPRITDIPQRIKAFTSHARFIYIMRDPVERTISHYWHYVNVYAEMRDIREALKDNSEFLDVSYYAYQLKPYFSLFGQERVLTLTFEELTRDPRLVIQGVFAWLGVEDTFVPSGLGTPRNVTPPDVRVARGIGLLHRVRFSRPWTRIGSYFPVFFRRVGKRMAERSIARQSFDMTAVVDRLRAIHQPRTAELTSMLGRDFPEWTTLAGTKTPPFQTGSRSA